METIFTRGGECSKFELDRPCTLNGYHILLGKVVVPKGIVHVWMRWLYLKGWFMLDLVVSTQKNCSCLNGVFIPKWFVHALIENHIETSCYSEIVLSLWVKFLFMSSLRLERVNSCFFLDWRWHSTPRLSLRVLAFKPKWKLFYNKTKLLSLLKVWNHIII